MAGGRWAGACGLSHQPTNQPTNRHQPTNHPRYSLFRQGGREGEGAMRLFTAVCKQASSSLRTFTLCVPAISVYVYLQQLPCTRARGSIHLYAGWRKPAGVADKAMPQTISRVARMFNMLSEAKKASASTIVQVRTVQIYFLISRHS